MLIPRPALAELSARLRRLPDGLRRASVETQVDPLDLVRAGAESFGSAIFFSGPGGRALAGLGRAWTAVAAGPDRFGALDRSLIELPDGAEVLIGFSFAPGDPVSPEWEDFPAAVALLPEIQLSKRSGRSRLTVAVPPGGNPATVLGVAGALRGPDPPAVPQASGEAQERPPGAEWAGLVADTVRLIRAGGLAKVVLARSVQVGLERPIPPFDLVAHLRDRCPGCHPYGWQQGLGALVGASPELLVSRSGEWFETRPLAGSAARGTDPEEDRRLGDRLLGSAKDRAEHDFVVEEMVARLAPLVDTLDRPPGPRLERLAGVQHLATPISGTTGSRLLSLVGALHPTAAVGGVPRGEALGYIEKVEGIDRGWYSGGIGWAEPGGDGEVVMALRCALVRGETATLYAGNGIVTGSDPAAELEESLLKMAPLLELLGAC